MRLFAATFRIVATGALVYYGVDRTFWKRDDRGRMVRLRIPHSWAVEFVRDGDWVRET